MSQNGNVENGSSMSQNGNVENGSSWLKPQYIVPIIAALIGAVGLIFATVINDSNNGSSPTDTPLIPPNPCLEARIDEPAGQDVASQARRASVSSDIVIEWTPDECVMTVEFLRNEELVEKYFDTLSGDTIDIGPPGSGATEIKIWVEGESIPSDSIWVWVDEDVTPTP